MILSHESQAILGIVIADLQRKINNERITFPLGKQVHEEAGISKEQTQRFVEELRSKILFPNEQ